MASLLDGTVVDEMARRLRNAGLWDNNLGDGLAMLSAKLEAQERFWRYEGWDYDKIRRPLASWEQCRQLLAVISASRFQTFTDIPAPVEACLDLAVLLAGWEVSGMPVPSDIRGMAHGAIAVEWSKPACSVILDGAGVHGNVPNGARGAS
jgi:hypothetical protein